MSLELQYKIKSNPMYHEFIRQNSIWYKYLNRNPNNFKYFVDAVKERYELKPSARFNKMLNNINMLQAFLDMLK